MQLFYASWRLSGSTRQQNDTSGYQHKALVLGSEADGGSFRGTSDPFGFDHASTVWHIYLSSIFSDSSPAYLLTDA